MFEAGAFITIWVVYGFAISLSYVGLYPFLISWFWNWDGRVLFALLTCVYLEDD